MRLRILLVFLALACSAEAQVVRFGGSSITDSNVCTDTLIAKAGPNLATSGTLEETLYLITITANTLSANGDSVRVFASASTVASTDVKYLRIRYNGLAGAIVSAAATNVSAEALATSVTCLRNTSTTLQCREEPYGKGTGTVLGTQTVLTGVNFAADFTLNVTGASAVTGEMTLLAVTALMFR